MQNPQLISYINKQRQQGVSDEHIKQQLQQVGWNAEMVNEAFHGDSQIPLPPLPGINENHPVKVISANVSMWDAFQHILMFISLAAFVIPITLILHIVVDKWVPEVTAKYSGYYEYVSSNSNFLRGQIAAVLVAYPLFAFLFLKIHKQTLLNPDIKKLNSRKVLTYFTLVIAFLFILGNIIGIVYSFLDGNISFNFVAHFLVTVIVSSVIFWYFLKQVKGDKI